MELELLSNDVAKEVLTILLYSDTYIQEKIPEIFLKRLTILAADSDLEVRLHKNKNLKDQNISNDALDMLAIIYYQFVATNEEKNNILCQWVINDKNIYD